MTLETYIKRNYKDIYGEYQMFCRKDKLPTIGQKVKTKHGGYGNFIGGQIFTVTDIGFKGQPTKNGSTWGDDYIELGREYLCRIDNWWKEIEIISK